MTAEEQNTKMLLGALLEFGKFVKDTDTDWVDIPEVLGRFLQKRGVEFNLTPNFQWERECLKLMEVELEG